jgi:haloacid dehalogenase-like hydrolase
MGDPLPSWRAGVCKQAIQDFVERVTADGSPDFVAPEERVAVFDNDGTLWCEKPMPIQLDFILRRLAVMAEQDPELRTRQPWQAAYTQHPTLGRGYLTCAYRPIVELLGYLEAGGFGNYIASGGGRDFMRPISQEVYGIPRQRVIGSSTSLAYQPDGHGGRIVRKPEADVLDDGPAKPVRIWSRVGRRPVLAAGNSNGDIPMLAFAEQPGRPSLRLLVLHDDAEREFDYTAGAEQALERARTDGWTVVSIAGDWATVF